MYCNIYNDADAAAATSVTAAAVVVIVVVDVAAARAWISLPSTLSCSVTDVVQAPP